MPKLFALSWRFLLVAALVLNPMAGAAAMLAAASAENSTQAVAQAGEAMPPCHAMAHEPAAEAQAPVAPRNHHGDCGNPACQFAACCIAGALDLSTPVSAPPIILGAQPLPSFDIRRVAAPPSSRMIRPPIA
jgi:hypothetical protein